MPSESFELAIIRPYVESAIGRPLRLAEQIIDVFTLSIALDNAKDKLHYAIEAEKERAIGVAIRTGHPVRLHVTREMLAPLEELFRLGATEAHAELIRAGYRPARALAEDAETVEPLLDDQVAKLKSGLNGLSVRLQIEMDTKRVALLARNHGSIAEALATALLRIPGGRAIAAGLVSTSLFSGMAPTFEENADLIAGWEYTAVLDGGTCEVCEPLDGTVYDTLDALFEVLPDFGPNPECLGGDRCRCRAVPAAS